MSTNRILLLYICLVLTLNLILGFFIFRSLPDNNNQLQSKLNEIQNELALKPVPEQTKKLILDEPTPSPDLKTESDISKNATESLGYITISDEKFEDVNIYADRSYSSKIIAKATFAKAYRYLKKEDSWYLISIVPGDKTGWVSGRFFKEIVEGTP